jgi:hypothetical protein
MEMVWYALALAMEMVWYALTIVCYGMVCIGNGNGNGMHWYGMHCQCIPFPCHCMVCVIIKFVLVPKEKFKGRQIGVT